MATKRRGTGVGSKQFATTTRARAGQAIRCEPLEHRLMMARIHWINRGNAANDTDGFNAAYGAKAGDARQLVDIAIADWSYAVQDFKYADTSHTNELELDISAKDENFGLAFTQFQKVDSQGKPFRAEIVIDDNAQGLTGGWFIGAKWLSANSFINHGDFDGEYNTTNPFRSGHDFYTVILHELGHALGIGIGGGIGNKLALEKFLTPVAGQPNIFNFKAGNTTAQFTSEGGGHIVAQADLMNMFTPDRHRRLISPLDVAILRDAYGFTTIDPLSKLPTISLDPPVYWEQYCTYYDLTLPEGLGCTIQASSFPPKLDAISDVTVNEGQPITFDAVARDENPGEIFVYSLGQGAPTGAQIDARTGAFSFTPTDGPKTFNITVSVSDNGCGCASQSFSDSKTFKVTVNNVDPSSSGITGPAVGVRGQPLSFSLTASDVGAVDTSTGFTYLVDWGDGSMQTILPTANNGSGRIVDHAYANVGPFTAKVKAVDKDNGTSPESSFAVAISAFGLQTDPNDPTKTAFVLGGGALGDRIRVKREGKKGVKVEMNKETVGFFNFDGRVIIYGQDGDDDIEIANDIEVPAEVYGGGGNDRVKAGRGPAILLGNAGDDNLEGGDDRDILIGGLGTDKLRARQADDILVGGATAYENNPSALRAIHAEWLRTDLTYGQRVASITAGVGGAALNATTVADDFAADELSGEGNLDWYLRSVTDVVKGLKAAETVTAV